MTYIARRLPFVHINHDAIRLFFRQKNVPEREGSKILYQHLFVIHLTKHYLLKRYNVIVDRDFGTNDKNILVAADREIKKLGARFSLIGVETPRWFIKKKILTRKLIPPERGGIPDRKTAMDCYRYSLTHYKENYVRLTRRALAVVDTSKPLSSQLQRPLKFLKREMGF